MSEVTNEEERPRRLLSIKQVLEIVPVSESTLTRMIRKGGFPPSHSISPNRCAWYEDEVLAWQRTLPVNDKIIRRARLREEA